MEAEDLPCSRNARSRTPLVGRAQWKINQPPSLKREQANLERSFGRIWIARCVRYRTTLLTPLHRFSIGLCIHRAHATGRFSNNRFSRGYFC
jgi:hypothetical protein